MFATSVNLLLSRAGYAGAELLRILSAPTADGSISGKSLLSRFVHLYRSTAEHWVGATSSTDGGLNKSQLDQLIEPFSYKVETLAIELSRTDEEIVRILNNALFQAVQLSIPDGERVSERAMKRLDEELASVSRAASGTA
jgi:hypothetical protein